MIMYNMRKTDILENMLRKLYTIVIIMTPILAIYGIGVSTITLFDFILMSLNMLMIIHLLSLGKLRIFYNIIPYGFYVFITMIFQINNNELVFRSLRYLLYILNIIIFVKNYFDYELGIRTYKIVAWISTIFLFIQISLNKLLGIYLPGVLTKLPLVDTDLLNYNEVFKTAQVKRCMAFFAEPSHYAIFILGYLVILLFNKNKKGGINSFLFEGILLSIGIILSTSILGVTVMIFIWIIWIIFNFRLFILKPHILLMIILISFTACCLLSDTSALKYITNSSVIERQSQGRFEGYNFINSSSLTLSEKVFGQGMTKIGIDVYLASYPIIIFYFGYLGLILYGITFIPYILNMKNDETTVLLICMLGISIGSEILVGNFIMIFFSLIITSSIYNKKT